MVLEHLEAVLASKRLVFGRKPPEFTISLKEVNSEKSLKKAESVSDSRVITPKPPEMGSTMDVSLQETFWEGEKKAHGLSRGLKSQNHPLKACIDAKIEQKSSILNSCGPRDALKVRQTVY